MENEAQGREYPESHVETEQALAQSDRQLKLNAGDKVRFRIVSGPMTYKEFYHDTGVKGEGGKTKKVRFAVPFASQIPGYDWRVKHMVEVVMCDGPAKGMHRIFEYGMSIAKQLLEVKSNYGSVRQADISIKREGATKNDTKYYVQPVPLSTPGSLTPEYDLEREARFSSKEDIDQMPAPMGAGRQPDSVSGPVTSKQIELINAIGREKDLEPSFFKNMIQRKFEKATVQELTVGEASQLIDAMRAI